MMDRDRPQQFTDREGCGIQPEALSEELCSQGVMCFGDGMLGVADTCPHFMCFGHVPGGIESLEVETHARPRDIETWIGPAVGYCFWVRVAKSEIETGFNSRGGGALSFEGKKMAGEAGDTVLCITTKKICFNFHQLTCSYFDFTSAVT
jgi:hypothetical protein